MLMLPRHEGKKFSVAIFRCYKFLPKKVLILNDFFFVDNLFKVECGVMPLKLNIKYIQSKSLTAAGK